MAAASIALEVSAVPILTGIPGGKPQARAQLSRKVPTVASPETTGGNQPRGMPNSSHHSGDHRPARACLLYTSP
ncbi:MAG: hypothetical protein N2439_05120, partial [Anaerolineae bacterium]|nr:hypothetical protein [Anaerolineae bacterium]